MILLSTFACVLALVAGVLAVLAWTTCARHMREQESWRSTTAASWKALFVKAAAQQQSAKELLAELERRSPTKVAAEVAELREAVERLAATQRRFAGRFYQGRQEDPVADGKAAHAANGAAVDDPELQAMLALQTAGPSGGP